MVDDKEKCITSINRSLESKFYATKVISLVNFSSTNTE